MPRDTLSVNLGMIIGHARQIRYLERVLVKGTFAHAYLFTGPEGVGKRSVAMAAAGRLLCAAVPSGADFGGCGECEDCRLVSRSLHADLIVLSPEQPLVEGKNERDPSTSSGQAPSTAFRASPSAPPRASPFDKLRASIGIENIHELQRRLALSSWRGGRKVVIIDQAESLSRAAQSSLLKILEEPDEKTVFFIIVRSSDALLPTVRSRAVGMSFTTVSEDELAPLAAGIPARQAEELLALAEGRPGVLVRLMQDKDFREEYRAAAERSTGLRTADLAGAFAFSEEHGRDDRALESALTHLAALARRDLSGAVRAVEARRAESPPEGMAPSPENRLAGLTSLLALILERLRILETTTANRRLVADGVFFELSSRNTRQP